MSARNTELAHRVVELSRLNKDLSQLLASAGIAAVFVDQRMRILRFTSTAATLINLTLSDVGRPLGHIVSRLFRSEHLVADVQAVLDGHSPQDAQLQIPAGLWFETRIRPYRQLDNTLDGATITFVDITEIKRLEQALYEGEERYRAMVDWSPEAINVLRDGKFIYVNPAAIEMYGATCAQDLLGQASSDRVHPDDLHIAQVRMNRLTTQRVNAPLVEMRFFKLDGSEIVVQAQAKPIDYEGAPAVHVAWRDITERKKAETALRESRERMQIADQVLHLAFHDTLTSLPNRRVLNDRLHQTMVSSKRSACYGALMFLDLDNFKSLNDAHGHAAGDLLLIEAAQRLKNCVREMDTVARFGGDEFVVMLSQLDTDRAESTSQARTVAEKISVMLAQPYQLSLRREGQADLSVDHHCSVSIGVALFINDEASHDEILKWADTAMYRAKKTGPSLIHFHDPGT
jgi:diguanylate cyclase (GGDEF)-like protein/PAS domain S-box-containing protein